MSSVSSVGAVVGTYVSVLVLLSVLASVGSIVTYIIIVVGSSYVSTRPDSEIVLDQHVVLNGQPSTDTAATKVSPLIFSHANGIRNCAANLKG